MIQVSVENLNGGEILAQDVTRPDGVILMGAGTAISDDSIRLLQRLEIESVVVEGDLFASDEERAEFIAEQEKALEMRFSKVENDRVLMAIREMFRKRLKAGCTLGAPPPGEEY